MRKKEETVRFTVSLPKTLLEELDEQLEKGGYSSRSEFVRDLVRDKMVDQKWQDAKEDVVGVLTISYDHHQPGLMRKLLEVQHSRYVNVLYSGHVHLDHHNCLETILIKGKPRQIEQMATKIGGLRGVRLARLTHASSVEI
jgi:CopG family nickel-responsive transcriptional regulator